VANDADETYVAGDGHIYVAPYGTPLPSDFNDVLDAAFIDMGYLTTDGFRMTPDLSSTDFFVWQSRNPVRTVVESDVVTLSLDFVQANEETAKLYFGGGSFTGTVYTPPTAGETDERSLVADVFDGTRQLRFWFPKVTRSASRELAFQRSAMSQFGLDLKVLAVGDDPPFQFDFGGDAEFYPGD
jgi:hypothetical protein